MVGHAPSHWGFRCVHHRISYEKGIIPSARFQEQRWWLSRNRSLWQLGCLVFPLAALWISEISRRTYLNGQTKKGAKVLVSKLLTWSACMPSEFLNLIQHDLCLCSSLSFIWASAGLCFFKRFYLWILCSCKPLATTSNCIRKSWNPNQTHLVASGEQHQGNPCRMHWCCLYHCVTHPKQTVQGKPTRSKEAVTHKRLHK